MYNLLRKGILEGKFIRDQKLPGSRSLAKALGISRNTVDLAFDQLMIEGYIYKKRGSGSYVSEVPDNFFSTYRKSKGLKLKSELPGNGSVKQNLSAEVHERQNRRIKEYGSLLTERIKESTGESGLTARFRTADEIIPFQNGIPTFSEFPFKVWQRIADKVILSAFKQNMGYGDAAGYRPLREAVASYLGAYRAVNCKADQVLIVNGTQQALDLTGRVLLAASKKKPVVWVEDPGYFSARASLLFSGAEIRPCRVDKEGLDLEHAVNNYPVPDLIFLTPSHQFPLGYTMSISRRLSILQYAMKNNCWIFEDDYDSAFRYSGDPLPSLQGIDQYGRVLYSGTFSKVLFPGLRIGYIILPAADMADAFATVKSITDRQNPVLEQMILAQFIKEGHFSKHLRKMRLLYKTRQDFLVKEINKGFGGILKAEPSSSGMHIISWLPEKVNDKKIALQAIKHKVIARALSEYSVKYYSRPGLLLGYSAFSEEEMIRGLSRLKRILVK